MILDQFGRIKETKGINEKTIEYLILVNQLTGPILKCGNFIC